LTLEMTGDDAGQNGKRYSRGEDQGGSLSHISNAPQNEFVTVESGKPATLSS